MSTLSSENLRATQVVSLCAKIIGSALLLGLAIFVAF